MLSGWYPTEDSGHGLVSIVCTTLSIGRVDDRDGVAVRVGDEQRVAADVHRGRVQADGDRSDRRGRVRGVDDADLPGRRRAQVPVGGHRGAVGVHGRVAGLGLAAALVAHVELAAREGELARGDADVPRVLDRTGAGVDRHDGVLPVERGVQSGPVGRVRRLAHQRGVGRRSPAVTRKVGAHRREREAGRRAEGAVGVDREPGQGVLLRKPEELAVRRVRRAFLSDRGVGQGLVDPGCAADRPDELVGRQVEDLQHHRLVGAGRGEEPPVRADRRAHELAELGEQPVTDRLEDLVVGDLDSVGVLRADLVVAEPHRRAVGGHSPADDEECRCAGYDDAEPAADPFREAETDFRDFSSLSRDLHALSLRCGSQQIDKAVELP